MKLAGLHSECCCLSTQTILDRVSHPNITMHIEYCSLLSELIVVLIYNYVIKTNSLILPTGKSMFKFRGCCTILKRKKTPWIIRTKYVQSALKSLFIRRYYMDGSSTIPDMEQSLTENPHDVRIWIKLAYNKLHEKR